MRNYTVYDLIDTANEKGYTVFRKAPGKFKNLNIWGIRSRWHHANSFNDHIVLFWENKDDVWTMVTYPATTDPGVFYRENPINPLGTLIMCPGQYRSAFSLGIHSDYEALIQSEPISVYRDNDRNDRLDFRKDTIESGMFGANIHRAASNGLSIQVDKWSAGCQVLQNRYNPLLKHDVTGNSMFEYDHFLKICYESAHWFGPYYTYTLVEEGEIV